MSLYEFDTFLGIMLHLLVQRKLPSTVQVLSSWCDFLEDTHEGIDEFRHLFSGLLSSSTGILGQDTAVGLGGQLHRNKLRCAAAFNSFVCESRKDTLRFASAGISFSCFYRCSATVADYAKGCLQLKGVLILHTDFVNRKPGRSCLMVTRRMVLHVVWPIRHGRMAMLIWMDLVTEMASFIQVISKDLILVSWTMLFLYFVGMWTDHGRGTWVIAGCRWTSAAGGGLEGVCSGVVVDKVLKILQNVLHRKAWQHESFQTPCNLRDLQPDLVFNFKWIDSQV